MMAGFKSNKHKHAYEQAEMDRVKGIPLPQKIKCGRCEKNLSPPNYSTKQLTDARYQIQQYGRIVKPIICKKCSGQQIVELTCSGPCGRTQGLEAFAKSQRSKPEDATCFDCMESKLALHAVDTTRYDDPDKAFLPKDTSDGKAPDYYGTRPGTDAQSIADNGWGAFSGQTTDKTNDAEDGGIQLSHEFQTLQVNGSVDDSLIGSEYNHPSLRKDDGSTKVRSNKSWHTASAGPVSTGSSFNKNIWGNSVSSAAGTERSFPSSVAERSSPENRSGAWARIKSAANPPPMLSGPSRPSIKPRPSTGPMRPMGDLARDSESLVDAWASDESDEEDGKKNKNNDDDDDDSDDETVI
ncbi:hypothetical protein NX059_008188 [Plenodomus lindquistii]|nr:hypothetical protein NX059_008188 [Plenodomus lindquistii]